jgi:hypothetical protein
MWRSGLVYSGRRRRSSLKSQSLLRYIESIDHGTTVSFNTSKSNQGFLHDMLILLRTESCCIWKQKVSRWVSYNRFDMPTEGRDVRAHRQAVRGDLFVRYHAETS